MRCRFDPLDRRRRYLALCDYTRAALIWWVRPHLMHAAEAEPRGNTVEIERLRYILLDPVPLECYFEV